jgi:nucleotide-binding universal stress UspA family protein
VARCMSNAKSTRISILAAIDYSEVSGTVVEQAIATAQRFRPCSLHLVHVSSSSAEDEEGREGARIELLEWLSARLPEANDDLDGVAISAHEVSGAPWRAIVQMASDLGTDIVVLGTHGRRGLKRIMLGSVAEAVSRHCGCSVLVVREKGHNQPQSELDSSCSLCVEARLQSMGKQLWCHDHVARKDRSHVRYGQGLGQWVRQSLGG